MGTRDPFAFERSRVTTKPLACGSKFTKNDQLIVLKNKTTRNKESASNTQAGIVPDYQDDTRLACWSRTATAVVEEPPLVGCKQRDNQNHIALSKWSGEFIFETLSLSLSLSDIVDHDMMMHQTGGHFSFIAIASADITLYSRCHTTLCVCSNAQFGATDTLSQID